MFGDLEMGQELWGMSPSDHRWEITSSWNMPPSHCLSETAAHLGPGLLLRKRSHFGSTRGPSLPLFLSTPLQLTSELWLIPGLARHGLLVMSSTTPSVSRHP